MSHSPRRRTFGCVRFVPLRAAGLLVGVAAVTGVLLGDGASSALGFEFAPPPQPEARLGELHRPSHPGREMPGPPRSTGLAPDEEELPPLAWELAQHGGSYLYAPEGDRLGWPDETHRPLLRIPETYPVPQPFTIGRPYLGADWVGASYGPVALPSHGVSGDALDHRFTVFGSYQIFGFGFHRNTTTQAAIGHQLLIDIDYQWSGTERAHVQFRPLGQGGTGGSFYQFTDPSGYINNGTLTPDRYWIEGELASTFAGWLDPFKRWDINYAVGKYPFFLHNGFLLNDDILGFAVGKNTIFGGPVSNLNVQLFAAFDDVDTFVGGQNGQVFGTHAQADIGRNFFEATYAYLRQPDFVGRDAQYVALSGTTMRGAWTFAGRTFFKFGDDAGPGSGQLFVAEILHTRLFHRSVFHLDRAVSYCNLFHASSGWNSIAGGNFNRIQTSFAVNPLIRLSAFGPAAETTGVALGTRLTTPRENAAIIPELAVQSLDGQGVVGVGLTGQLRTSIRTFFEATGVANFSEDPQFDRRGVFLSQTMLF